MPEWLAPPAGVEPLAIGLRLSGALVLGWAVAWVHGRTSTSNEMGASFPSTLVMLAVLIAAVTQVIGDNVARAFSLVGALSIVRFRTVVRDTRDTAFVIFAVVVGMAAGAQNVWVAVLGLAVGTVAAFALAHAAANGSASSGSGAPPFEHMLRVRAAMGVELEKAVTGILVPRRVPGRLALLGTTKQSTGIEGAWEVAVRQDAAVEPMIREIARLEGIQDVRLERRTGEEHRR